jgi:aminoglycoside phosphotransferase (APT) family kinase protein
VSQEVQAALREHLDELFGAGTRVARAALLGGGASMEAWAVDAETPRGPLPLLLRRAAGGRIYSEALSLAQEFRVLQAAWEEGVLVPRPYRHFPDVAAAHPPGRRAPRRPGGAAARRRAEAARGKPALPRE